MKVLEIVGSPRRDQGRCHSLVAEVLEGARHAGAVTETLYLIDGDPQYCRHCCYPCFDRPECAQERQATERSALIESADALVIAAPVYIWQVSGLTATLFDKMRLSTGAWNRPAQHGKQALGIAVAGGTGTGVFSAMQSIYAWMCLWKYRPLPGLPLTRFNMDAALEQAPALGRQLATLPPEPFVDVGELLDVYDSLPYARHGRADEFHWLAQQIVSYLEHGHTEHELGEIRELLKQRETHLASGNTRSAARCAADAYAMAASLCD